MADTRVPGIVNQTVDQANALIVASKLVPGVLTRDYNNSVDKDLVISQSQPAGTVVPEGSTLDFVVSKGKKRSSGTKPPSPPKPTTPPAPTIDVDAIASVLEARLGGKMDAIVTRVEDLEKAKGGTPPEPPKPTIDPATLSKLKGSNRELAKHVVTSLGLTPVEIGGYSDTVAADTVISVSQTGDQANIEYSMGADPSKVPPTPPEPTALAGVIAGSIPSMVRSQLMMSGYKVEDSYAPSPYVKKGRVVEAVETAPKKATIIISSGKPDGGGEGGNLFTRAVGGILRGTSGRS